MKTLFIWAAIALSTFCVSVNAQTVATIGLDTIQFGSSKSESGSPERAGELAGALAKKIRNDLSATRKFKVLTYLQATEALAEHGLSVESVTDSANAEILYDTPSIDYILRTKVVDYDPQSEQAEVELKLVSTSYSLSDHVVSSNVDLSETGSDRAASVAAIASAVVTETVASVFPMRVMNQTEDGLVIINYGQGYLVQGDKLKVFSPVAAPNNGAVEVGPVAGNEIAEIEIVSSNEKFSSGKIVQGQQEIGLGYKAKLL